MFRYRTRSIALATFLALFGALAGGETAHADPPDSPFAGLWAGTFTTDNGFFGPVTLNVDDNGLLTGEATFYPGHVMGEIVGHVNNDGFGFYAFRNPPDQVIPYLLFVSIDEDGNMSFLAPAMGWGDFTVEAALEPL